MTKGTDLWNKAKKIIPGGNQLLSKRAEMFLPEHWPAYFEKAKGVVVTDLDGKSYIDMSIMGIGACVLGYAESRMEKKIIDAVKRGVASTFNAPEEVALAGELIALHPWAGMARFARTGGEANAVAVRIARAFTKKDKVAFCGYHGWHDWYLAANLADETSLDGQLLPGLKPAGVPRALRGTSMPFTYGDLEGFKKIVAAHRDELGVVIMEVARHGEPDLAFLKGVRDATHGIGAVLIYDEISSGFRVNIGGIHMKYGLEPDMATFGKALGNGYAIAAILGRSHVMEAAQGSFISSTNWTERIGFVAGLETIRQYKAYGVADALVRTGLDIRKKLGVVIARSGLDIRVIGLPSIITLVIKEQESLLIKTLITQEMMKRGFLASNIIYVTRAHTPRVVNSYVNALGDVLMEIAGAVKQGTARQLLEGPVCHSGFARLN